MAATITHRVEVVCPCGETITIDVVGGVEVEPVPGHVTLELHAQKAVIPPEHLAHIEIVSGDA